MAKKHRKRKRELDEHTPKGTEILRIPLHNLQPWAVNSVLDGYQWGCQCGESYKTSEAAEDCKKCRRYIKKEDRSYRIYFTPLPKHNAHIFAYIVHCWPIKEDQNEHASVAW